MVEIYRFMEIDTCPMCGNEIYARENSYIGERDIKKIPPDTVFEIPCTDETGTNLTCGYFSIKRRNQTSLENDWVAEYIITAPSPYAYDRRLEV